MADDAGHHCGGEPGPHEAVRLLVEHRASIFAFIYALVRDHDASEDIFQDVSVAVCQSYDQFEPGTSFAAWAREIARRRLFAYRRSAARFPQLLSDEGLARLQIAFDTADELGESAPERMQALRRCLDRLNAKGRRLVAMRYREHRSLDDMAAALNRQTESVRKGLYRTRQLLKDCIERRLGAEHNA